MPRYFFHIRRDEELIRDPDGTEMVDLDAAKKEAVLSAREILAGRVLTGEIIDGDVFEITDEADRVLAAVSFVSALRIAP